MIPANKYCFVNVNGNFIRNSTAEVASSSPVPTYEIDAFIREIYRTAKAWNEYSIGCYSDRWPYIYSREDVPMLARNSVWIDRYNEIRNFINVIGKRPNRGSGDSKTSIASGYILAQETGPHASISETWVENAMMLNSTSPNLPEVNGSTVPPFVSLSQFEAVRSFLKNKNSPESYAKEFAWKTYCKILPLNVYPATNEWFSVGSMSDYFKNRGVHWELNGSTFTGTVPSTFLGVHESGIKGQFYVRFVRDGVDDTYTHEGSWYYSFSWPTWKTQRSDDDQMFLSPVFRIRFTRVWQGYESGSPVASDILWDAKYHDFFYIPGKWPHPYSTKYVSIPQNGGDVNISPFGPYTSDTVRQLGNIVLQDSGALNIEATEPYTRTPGRTYSVVGYEANIDLAGMHFARRACRRNFNDR